MSDTAAPATETAPEADTIPPLRPLPGVVEFLSTRRSRPAKTLGPEGPSREELVALLRIAVRCPDHGKLEPWRFVVMDRAAMARVAEAAHARALALGQDAEGAEKTARSFREGGAVVAVIASPKPSPKIPRWEQEMSAGAVCMTLLTAALAAGWGANWLTGPLARDEGFLRETLGAAEGEFVAGFLHLGRETAVPPDRPRPDPEALATWL